MKDKNRKEFKRWLCSDLQVLDNYSFRHPSENFLMGRVQKRSPTNCVFNANDQQRDFFEGKGLEDGRSVENYRMG